MIETAVEMQAFGPLLASVFGSFPDEPRLQLIQGAAEPGAVEEGHLAAAVEWMEEREVDYLVPVAAERPGTRQAEEWLNWHNYEQSSVVRQYARSAEQPPASEARGVEVLELYPEEGEGMDEIAATGLGFPVIVGVVLFNGLPNLEDWHCYVALIDGVPAACGSMLIADGVAVLGVDGTRPLARDLGCNKALLCRRLQDAARAGCHTVLASGPEAATVGSSETVRNLLSMGFVEISRSVNWRAPSRVW